MGVVRLMLFPTHSFLHGWVAQASMQKKGGEGLGSRPLAVGAPWDMHGGVGRVRETSGCWGGAGHPNLTVVSRKGHMRHRIIEL